ncbi:hypothetical protein [Rathayibacter toxicus]|uniref:hypothetical protein n=1 Tax=Rathayibacter toxicus TaxID=145458 RepID=UPI001C05E4FF|nr:hypothetical protein [Rathayibacter toxicus]QWL33256.1 hypothetical protein E2R35_10760 [Rathayibacter toxicus]QWL35351.1 hypothetical protein E2R36_10760 [Rathayibacter toxicus]QWL39575.1 hypothetical protein E2R38_10755 [Rathayibacter toxicus]QWL41658.1 hypothetical protein E2R39_10755 [Rathayibacter toxicus]QWL43767.1 hypothetical protein E2R40_10755 [Rathayibacter toxicus]
MSYLSEDERQQTLHDLRKTAPESVDVEQLVAGELRAGVSENRPPVPVWEYREYAQQHPGTSLDELADIRFPVLLADDSVTVTSIAVFLVTKKRDEQPWLRGVTNLWAVATPRSSGQTTLVWKWAHPGINLRSKGAFLWQDNLFFLIVVICISMLWPEHCAPCIVADRELPDSSGQRR